MMEGKTSQGTLAPSPQIPATHTEEIVTEEGCGEKISKHVESDLRG